METEEVEALRLAAKQFAQREVDLLVGTEGRDGNLSRLSPLLSQAEEIGLMATPYSGSAGFELGVWGRTGGYVSSLFMLQELAVSCAGVSACVHFAGLGAHELSHRELDVQGSVAVALFHPGWRPNWESLASPPESAPRVAGSELSGRANFVLSAPGTTQFVVYAEAAGKWSRWLVPRAAQGVHVAPIRERTGLAALEVLNLEFSKVPISRLTELPPVTPHAALTRFLLGLSAIAVGNAQGAIARARGYAKERYQGGQVIDQHPAVRLLIGDAAARVAAAEAHLHGLARRELRGVGGLWHAAVAKLRISLDCDQAVTDSLQVFGGNGYMEDYRVEKCLRDSMTIKAAGLNPNTLRLLCARDPGEL